MNRDTLVSQVWTVGMMHVIFVCCVSVDHTRAETHTLQRCGVGRLVLVHVSFVSVKYVQRYNAKHPAAR